MPSISVVVPAHNAARFLPYTIKSVQAQTIGDWELIIIDDGSTDETAVVIQPFLTDSRIQYFRQENQERSAARNNGIGVSKSRYVAFLDADDLWHPEKLAEQLRLMETDPTLGMCYTYAAVLNPNEPGPRRYAQPTAGEGLIFGDLLRGNFITISSAMVRMNVLKAVGVFDLDPTLLGSEDWDLWLRISRHYKVGVIRKYLTTYRTHIGIQSHLKIFQGALGVLNKRLAEPDFLASAPTSKHRAFSFAYLSAAGFSSARIRRLDRIQLLVKAIRFDWTALLTKAGVAAIAQVALPERMTSWIRKARAS